MDDDKKLKEVYEKRVTLIAKTKGIPESLVRAGLPFEVFQVEEARREWLKATKEE